jgi:hypothetical protein
VISRSDFANRRAWRKDARFFREVERGFASATEGYKRTGKKQHKLGRIPVLDLDFRHGEKRAGQARFLFFRRYTVMLVLSGSSKRAMKPIRDSFVPYFGPSSE